MRRTVLATLLIVVGGLSACDPTTGTPPSPGAQAPAYRVHIETVTAEDLGASYRPDCPVAPSQLRRVRVDYWGYDGGRHRGDLIVAASVADDVGDVFGELYDARFQIRRIHPVQRYGADDDASMAANNTSAFNCRTVSGTSTWSEHAYGLAIDINPIQNPFVAADGRVAPAEGRIWADRSLRVPGMIHRNGVAVRAFGEVGWEWGGDWRSVKDYQHFSLSGR